MWHASSSDGVRIRKIIGVGSTKDMIDEDVYPTRTVREQVGKGLAPEKGQGCVMHLLGDEKDRST